MRVSILLLKVGAEGHHDGLACDALMVVNPLANGWQMLVLLAREVLEEVTSEVSDVRGE